MPELTPRLGIKKPLGTEIVQRSVFNENYDIIDAAVATRAEHDAHATDTNNPHQTTYAQVGAAPASHVGAGGGAHPAATQSVAGFMSAQDKTKLDGIAAGAEVNQNAFSNVAVAGQTTVSADSKTDILTLEAGVNVQITTDATNDKVRISAEHTHPAQVVRTLYASDETEQYVTGTSETTIQTHKIAKCSQAGFNISKLSLVVNVRVTGGTGTLKVYVDGVLVLTIANITNTAYQLKYAGPVAVSWEDNTLHTVEVKLVNSGAYSTYENFYELYVE